MDRESPELIEQQMQQTRASLTEKVSALENQVLGTIQNATDAVQSTVESVKAAVHDVSATVKDTVSESVHTVRDQVKSTLDISRQTRENPWAMVGGAAAVGFAAGYFLFGPRGDHSGAARRAIGGSFDGLSVASRQPLTPPREAAAPRRPGWVDELLDRVGEEAKRLGEMALASATASLRETVQQQVPKLIEEGIPKLIGTNHRRQPQPAAEAGVGGAYSHPGQYEGNPYPRPTNGPERIPGGPVM